LKGGNTVADKNGGKKIIAQNRKAYHDYFVEETYEAGIELFGTEVKSVRLGSVNLKDSFCTIRRGEMFALGIRISPYEKGNIFNRDPLREKRLLMHKKEILKLDSYSARDGYSLIPLSLYFSGSRVKVEIGLCKGKKLYDKREAEAQKSAKREMERHLKV
jgi:SsrA-binding protein